MLTILGNIIEMLLKRQEVITSEDVKTLLKRTNIQISDVELAKALLTLEIYKKIHVKRVKREGRDIYQIMKRK